MMNLPGNAFVVVALVAIALVVIVVMLRRPSKATTLLPESLFVVTADVDGVRVVDPSGQTRNASWSLLEQLLIRTTDAGPLVPDLFWEVQPIEAASFIFPGGATGEAEFLEVAQARLPGFQNEQVIAAMSSTSNHEFVVWARDRYCPRCGHHLPELQGLSHAQRLELRGIIDSSGSISAIKRLREISGCDLKTATLWVHHRGIAGQGHEPLLPCPYCGEPLRQRQAKQCRFCKRDWHDPEHIRRLGE